ncbi:hypothetical protein F909_02203 [Acinetobacter sp. ANC 3929]|uniref:hypothetical protein n=1 Tax=unclassified Acinetobacter TaxID=196816 RepID=UPI0002CF4BE5|nr:MULTISPECIES: hypothetical protein [unclassified Acinetobacter]ENW80913.1 hypothetical protein F909_02203 [Acinetobacter sp. ANC 3929]MCH7353093.1 hypothetical protein [Acinetobacter sp. NIPH 2023]MCH7356927.1 hypothetical protein [Acinetobacter sp. NIPH 1958]MCH7360394.1 hypothetical protein [Acinetobacter sp. NIPH 2024]
MRKEFELHAFEEILNNVKSLYFFNLNVDKRFWQHAEYDFLIRFLHESSKIKEHKKSVDNYSSRLHSYFDKVIQNRLKLDINKSSLKLEGKILAFNVNLTMFDSLGEGETGGFIDGCDASPPEFWIHFDGENLYSFIPNELTNIVDLAIDISMSGSLEWYTDVIEI